MQSLRWGLVGQFVLGSATLALSGACGSGGDGGTGGTGGARDSLSTGGTANGSGGSGATNGGGTGAASAGGAPGSGAASGAGGSGTGGASNCTGPVAGTTGTNPLVSNTFTADPSGLVSGCTFYVTAGHDEGTSGFNLNEWYVLSSTDLVNWSGSDSPAMGLDTFEWANANAWAGQMVERDGKYYWYVPVNEQGGGMAIGVAVADSPTGPFEDALGEPLVNDAIEMEAFDYAQANQTVYTIDPTVFVDDDGQAYLLYGGFSRLVGVRLGDDMISIDGGWVERTPQNFFEAPELRKRGDTYYLVYAYGINPAALEYATASNPLGPWTAGGRILDPLPNHDGQDAATSHGSIVEFLGEWYLVYHLSNGPNGGGTYKRMVAMEKLTINDEGEIQKVTPSSGMTF